MTRPIAFNKGECRYIRVPLSIIPEVERLIDLAVAEKLERKAEELKLLSQRNSYRQKNLEGEP